MQTREISAKQLREQQAQVLNRVSYGKTHYVITRHGREEAVMISFGEYQLIEQALEELDEADVKAALKRAKGRRRKSLRQVAKEMEIDV